MDVRREAAQARAKAQASLDAAQAEAFEQIRGLSLDEQILWVMGVAVQGNDPTGGSCGLGSRTVGDRFSRGGSIAGAFADRAFHFEAR